MKRQNGAILAVCLVFLALLALMAVAGMESVLLHERTEANMRRFNDGFEAAEAALREAEETAGRQCPGANSAAPPSDRAPWPQTVRLEAQWWDIHGVDTYLAGGIIESPQYFLEILPGPIVPQDQFAPVYYRITARASSRPEAGSSVLQILGVAVCDRAGTFTQIRLSWRQLS